MRIGWRLEKTRGGGERKQVERGREVWERWVQESESR